MRSWARGPRLRMVLIPTLVIAGLLVTIATVRIAAKRTQLTWEIEQEAERFASLSTEWICTQYDHSSRQRFATEVRELLDRHGRLERITLAAQDGTVLFDTASLAPGPSRLTDPDALLAVAGLARQRLPTPPGAAQPRVQLVVPYVEEWGRHRFSVLYVFRQADTRREVIGMAIESVGGMVLLVAVSAAILSAIARRTTGIVVRPV
jgi:hypothetical protein